MLGHTWVVTRIYVGGIERDEQIFAQCSYGGDAARASDEMPDSQRGEIYERTGKWKGKPTWKRRSRALALLDQNPQFPYEPAMAEPQS